MVPMEFKFIVTSWGWEEKKFEGSNVRSFNNLVLKNLTSDTLI